MVSTIKDSGGDRVKRSKGFILLLSALVIASGLALYKFYPVLEALGYNKSISVSAVKLFMTEEALINTMDEKAEFVYGMGGNGWRFSDSGIFVMTSSLGLFKNRVALIDTENTSHSILGIKVGDNWDSAVTCLKKRGFKEFSHDMYTKGNVEIQLSGGSKISGLRIRIADPAYKDVQF
ncbi:hypothetical protein Dhaf_3204 [Desulfitobacterium hafniense DCB-2]|uniref:Uncharacterized protein n=3 Tax=Desulfitobacterium hafniense TaxID=49338 RepID=A0A0W1JJ72_DESHA|nr:hypothetical protein Dhaf_3204 [Desulfitobacterium hafniense DCB-2]EHL06603.1 hypothetical protein HMPREF0322_02652 [Desulfitobacterium hafniense DP7]KTE91406.1 hypothetical protein AT727_22485 [Desulfitobacterium hafniense]